MAEGEDNNFKKGQNLDQKHSRFGHRQRPKPSDPGAGSGHSRVQEETGRKNYIVKKRPPPEFVRKANDVFVSERSNFQSQLSKCEKLLDGQFRELFIHGLGAAIPKALNLSQELKKFYQGTVDFTVNTTTVKLIDDLIPLNDTSPPAERARNTSAVVIRVFRTVNIP